MKIIDPYFEVVYMTNNIQVMKTLEICTRVAYKSEDKITEGSAEKLIQSVLGKQHDSVIEHLGFTLKIVCDRGVSHEFVRHRLASFTQESTRYCNYGKKDEITVIRPIFFEEMSDDYTDWKSACEYCERQYMMMIKRGRTPQEARSVLPNSLKTEIVITTNFREWRHILKLRTAKNAHPQMRQIMIKILNWAKKEYPILFNDIICIVL